MFKLSTLQNIQKSVAINLWITTKMPSSGKRYSYSGSTVIHVVARGQSHNPSQAPSSLLRLSLRTDMLLKLQECNRDGPASSSAGSFFFIQNTAGKINNPEFHKIRIHFIIPKKSTCLIWTYFFFKGWKKKNLGYAILFPSLRWFLWMKKEIGNPFFNSQWTLFRNAYFGGSYSDNCYLEHGPLSWNPSHFQMNYAGCCSAQWGAPLLT